MEIYSFSDIEQRFAAAGLYFIDKNLCLCNPQNMHKIDFMLEPANSYYNNPEKIKEQFRTVNQFFKDLGNKHGIRRDIEDAMDRLYLHNGFIGKLKYPSIPMFYRYADELFLEHDHRLIIIEV